MFATRRSLLVSSVGESKANRIPNAPKAVRVTASHSCQGVVVVACEGLAAPPLAPWTGAAGAAAGAGLRAWEGEIDLVKKILVTPAVPDKTSSRVPERDVASGMVNFT